MSNVILLSAHAMAIFSRLIFTCLRICWPMYKRSCFPLVTSFLFYWKSSSSSCRAGSTDIPDPLAPLFPIVHRLRQVFWTTSCILTWMYVRAGRPAFARPCVGVHKSTSLMSSSLLLQQCPACLVKLTWIVFVIGGRWPYSWCLVGCCRQGLFKIARSILV